MMNTVTAGPSNYRPIGCESRYGVGLVRRLHGEGTPPDGGAIQGCAGYSHLGERRLDLNRSSCHSGIAQGTSSLNEFWPSK